MLEVSSTKPLRNGRGTNVDSSMIFKNLYWSSHFDKRSVNFICGQLCCTCSEISTCNWTIQYWSLPKIDFVKIYGVEDVYVEFRLYEAHMESMCLGNAMLIEWCGVFVVSSTHIVFFWHARWHVRYELYIILCTLP